MWLFLAFCGAWYLNRNLREQLPEIADTLSHFTHYGAAGIASPPSGDRSPRPRASAEPIARPHGATRRSCHGIVEKAPRVWGS
jgi:hypothetical protein